MIRKLLSFIVFVLLTFVAYLLYRTFTFHSKQKEYAAVAKAAISPAAAHRLAKAISIATVSYENVSDLDTAAFQEFGELLRHSYPLVHAHLSRKVFNNYSYLFTWQGSDVQLKPVVLVAHLDVVPVAEDDAGAWAFPPFGGIIDQGTVWGRGALDDKVSVMGILEAVEFLLGQNFAPQRTVLLAFGHDEEVGGQQGAKAIAEYMEREQISAEFVLDEGYAITHGLVPGVLTDVALIGIAEKGFASVDLSVEIDGGHSSMPHESTAIEALSRAVTRLADHPFDAEISSPVKQFISFVGPEMRFQEKLVFANSGIFESAILNIYQQSFASRALVQTTVVPTIFHAGIKDNVVPGRASVTVNYRILPGTSIDEIVEKTKQAIGDDRIELRLRDFRSEASPVSATDTRAFEIVSKSIKEVYPTVITVPNLVIAATDSRHFANISDGIYRFCPSTSLPTIFHPFTVSMKT
ncbi:MAG: M20/M25/M40 family metallo-hydrolase [Cyclobacteriaceae bacterium]|nr:M20/M25/M40 family metallo-hydrolase [Cyclobacteriaceae bacterium]